MKIFVTALVALTFLLAACSKKYDFPADPQYVNLYMPQATSTTITKGLLMSDEAQSLQFSVYYGGPGKPGQNINISFAASPSLVDSFNTANGTTYTILPEISYDLDKQGTIPAGSLTSGTLQLKVKTKGFLNVFESYLLPVSITSNDANLRVNANLKTTFFLITPSYAPGEVPREKVLTLDNGSLQAFPYASGDNIALIVRRADNNMWRYPKSAGNGFDAPHQIGTGWGDVRSFMPLDDRWVIWRENGTMAQFQWSPTGQFQGGYDVGSGWNNNDMIVGYKNQIYNRNIDTKALTRWPFAGCFCGGVFPVSGDWSSYTQIIPYKNTLLGVTASGDLWENQVTAAGEVSGTRKVGSGWDLYTKVIPFGDALLGLDSNGDVWRYNFDSRGFWALK